MNVGMKPLLDKIYMQMSKLQAFEFWIATPCGFFLKVLLYIPTHDGHAIHDKWMIITVGVFHPSQWWVC